VPNVGYFRNFLIGNNTPDMTGRPLTVSNPSLLDEVCFYSNVLGKRSD